MASASSSQSVVANNSFHSHQPRCTASKIYREHCCCHWQAKDHSRSLTDVSSNL